MVQAKLIRSKDQRVPRLQDLTMRPTLAGKTVGALEAHSNGLRFNSQKNSVSWREGIYSGQGGRMPVRRRCTLPAYGGHRS